MQPRKESTSSVQRGKNSPL